MMADRLTKMGLRRIVTAGTPLLAAPFIWASVSAGSAQMSFAALALGSMLSEAWRAPSAVMAR